MCLLIGVLGCSGGGSSPLAPVGGQVKYRGMALQGGTIVFIPDAARGHRGAMAMGQIAGDGRYTLRTSDTQGAAPGWYRVTIASMAYSSSQSVLPDKYRDPELSKLVCEVKAKSTNTIDFNLD